MLRIGRDVAWLRLGSCTDHVIKAAAAPLESASSPRPVSSRRRRASASRIAAGNWPTRGMTRSIAGMLIGPSRLDRDAIDQHHNPILFARDRLGESVFLLSESCSVQNLDQPVQCLGCCFTVGDQRQTNISGAGIAAVGLLP